jgi:poly(hydroxyalkanoate) granule-associated protein
MAGAKNGKTGEDASARDWGEQLKKFAYAAAGAVNVSQDDIKSFVQKLVEKGEIAQKDGRKILKDLSDRLRKTVREPRETAEKVTQPFAESGEKIAERINASIQRVLHGMNIATRQDLADLARQIDALDKKLQELVEASGAARAGTASQS